MSSAASPNIQFAQRVDGCLYLFKFSLGIEDIFFRKINILHFVVQPRPNITQQHYGSIATVLCERFAPVDALQFS